MGKMFKNSKGFKEKPKKKTGAAQTYDRKENDRGKLSGYGKQEKIGENS